MAVLITLIWVFGKAEYFLRGPGFLWMADFDQAGRSGDGRIAPAQSR
jgi:hypothetical protein